MHELCEILSEPVRPIHAEPVAVFDQSTSTDARLPSFTLPFAAERTC